MPVADRTLAAAAEALDRSTREVIAWHFDPETGCPFWLDYAKRLGWDPRTSVHTYADLAHSAASRTSGCAAVPYAAGCRKAYAEPAGLTFRDRRQHRRAQVAHQHRRLPHRLRGLQRHAARRAFPKGADWLSLGPTGPAPAAPGRRAPRAASRRHLLHGRSRSTLGHQAAQAAADGRGRALQAARHRAGTDAPARARQHPVPVHDAQAAGSALREGLAEEARASPASSAAAPR